MSKLSLYVPTDISTRTHLLSAFIVVLLFSFNLNLHAQNWEQVGYTPDAVIGYDQNAATKTVITYKNIYRSTDNGDTWQQQLPADHILATQDDAFINDKTINIYGDVIFYVVNFGYYGVHYDWKLYVSTNGGANAKEIFTADDFNTSIYLPTGLQIHKINEDTFLASFSPYGIRSFHISNDKGQNWTVFKEKNILNPYPTPFETFDFAGTASNQIVFLQNQDSLVYYDQTTATLNKTLALAEKYNIASVKDNDIRLISWQNGLTGYKSSDGGNTHQTYSSNNIPTNIHTAQIFDDWIFINAGTYAYNRKTYRLSFDDFDNPVNLSDDAFYSNFFPYRLTSDGKMTNQHTIAFLDYNAYQSIPRFFDMPFFVSDDYLTTLKTVKRPAYELAALPKLKGKHFRYYRDIVWNTTDGLHHEYAYRMTNTPHTIRYFEDAVLTASYSDPQTTYYLTNDASSNANQGIVNNTKLIQSQDALYASRQFIPYNAPDDTPLGIFESTDSGTTWTNINDGYYWGRITMGDPKKSTFYSFKTDRIDDDNYALYMSRSLDQGQHWEYVNTANFPTTTSTLYDSHITPHSPIVFYNNYIFLLSDKEKKLYYSINGGLNFQEVNNISFQLAYADMYILDEYLCFKTINEQFHRVNINEWLDEDGGTSLTGKTVDLELSISVDPPNPAIWTSFDVTYTITNKGALTASDVWVKAAVNYMGDAIAQGGVPPTYEGGNGFAQNNTATIASGETASVTYHYFRRGGAMPTPWGEIDSYFEPDMDSRPSNGTLGEVHEDDEVLWGATPFDPCDTDVTVPVLSNCPSTIYRITTGDYSIGTWTAPTATDNCSTPNITSSHESGDTFYTGTTIVTYTATDEAGNTATCTFEVIVNQQVNDNCKEIAYEYFNILCNDNNTPDNGSDDTWTVDFIADLVGLNCPNSIWIIPNIGAGNFGVATTLGPFLIADGNQNFTINKAGNNNISATFNIDPPATCSNGNTIDGVDLELSITSDLSQVPIYTSASIQLSIQNTGTTTATGIVVDIPTPDKLVYEGGNESVASQGTFSSYGVSHWDVGALDAGASATLKINYFLLTDEIIRFYAQVIAMNEADIDSNPNNGTCCIAIEDDESDWSWNNSPQANYLQTRAAKPALKLVRVFPNPARNASVNLHITAIQKQSNHLQIYNAFGHIVMDKIITLEEGGNEINIDINELPSGVYVAKIIDDSTHPAQLTTKFVVQTW